MGVDNVGSLVATLTTIVALAVWIDAWGNAMRAWQRTRHREALHNVVGIGMTVVVVIGTGVAQVAEYTPPPPPDEMNLIAVSAVRLVLVVVGVWMAVDSRIDKRRQ